MTILTTLNNIHKSQIMYVIKQGCDMKNTIISIAFISILLAGCSATKDWSATGGSKADGVIRLSYEFGQFEVPQVSEEQAILLAAKRCAVWGYTNAEAFGGMTKQCNMPDGFGGCSSWIVTKEYQCTGSAAQ